LIDTEEEKKEETPGKQIVDDSESTIDAETSDKEKNVYEEEITDSNVRDIEKKEKVETLVEQITDNSELTKSPEKSDEEKNVYEAEITDSNVSDAEEEEIVETPDKEATIVTLPIPVQPPKPRTKSFKNAQKQSSVQELQESIDIIYNKLKLKVKNFETKDQRCVKYGELCETLRSEGDRYGVKQLEECLGEFQDLQRRFDAPTPIVTAQKVNAESVVNKSRGPVPLPVSLLQSENQSQAPVISPVPLVSEVRSNNQSSSHYTEDSDLYLTRKRQALQETL